MAEHLSQAAYARHIGHSRQYVSKLVRKGVIKTIEGKIDPQQADKALEDNSSPAHAVKNKEGRIPITYKAAQTAKEIARAKLIQIQVREKEGSLVEIAQVQKDAFDAGRNVRDALLNIPDRISSILAGEKKEAKIRKMLTSEIKNALVDINPYEK